MWEMQALNTSQNSNNDSNILGGSISDHEQISDNKFNLNNNNVNSDDNMHIEETQLSSPHDTQSNFLSSNNGIIHSSITTAVTSSQGTIISNKSGLNLIPSSNDIDTQTVAIVETPTIHPALRGIKTVNIGI